MTTVQQLTRVPRWLHGVTVFGCLIGFVLPLGDAARADLIGHWTLDDGLADPDAIIAGDSSPNGIDGELINFVVSPWVSGQDAVYGGAINFEFEDAAVAIPVEDLLPIGNEPRTLAAWVNVAVMKDGKFLSYGEGANGSAFDFTVEEHDGSPHVWFRHWGGNIRFPGAEEGEFFHFAAVVPGGAEMTSDLQVYINGEESIGVRGAGEDRFLDTGFSDLFIGARHPDGAPNPFDGIVDDVWLFDEALDQAAIQSIMNGGFGGGTPLQPGDADQDLDFDQLDLVQVQVAAKYLTGQEATWGEGDWEGAPGGEPGSPPPGNGQFDQLDIIAALSAGKYLTGPYGAIAANGTEGDGQTSVIYHADTGEISVDAPGGRELTSINIDSAAGIFTGDPAQNLGGSFDNDADVNIFKATFGSSFGSLSFGNVAQPGLDEPFVLNDLTVVGSLQGGGDLGAVDLIYVPEPSALLLMAWGLFLASGAHRRVGRHRTTG